MATLSSAMAMRSHSRMRADNQYFPGVPRITAESRRSDTAYGNKPPSNFTAVTGWVRSIPKQDRRPARTRARKFRLRLTAYALLARANGLKCKGKPTTRSPVPITLPTSREFVSLHGRRR